MAVTPQERGRAIAAINRLSAQGRVNGRFPQVIRGPSPEDPNLVVEVHIHVGPNGDGRTIIIDKQVGNSLDRKMQGQDAYGITHDWFEIDLAKLL